MNGRRRADVIQDAEGWHPRQDNVQPGDYWKVLLNKGSVEWYACVPTGWLGCLVDHKVIEHEDGTITVSPSIQTSAPEPSPRYWHGYLERGVWRAV